MSADLSDDQLEEYKVAFAIFDQDSSGFIFVLYSWIVFFSYLNGTTEKI